MAEPGPNGIDVHPGLNQMAGRRMPDYMGRNRALGQLRHLQGASFYQPVDAEAGKLFAQTANKDCSTLSWTASETRAPVL